MGEVVWMDPTATGTTLLGQDETKAEKDGN